MSKRGLTLVELLAAIVLFGMIASLSAIMISTITKSNARIVEQSRVNSETTLLVAYLDHEIQSFSATTYTSCVESNCFIFVKEFDYVPNLENGTINLVIFNPKQEFKIELVNFELIINGINYNLEYFSIDASSSISYTVSGDEITYTIDLILVGEYDSYTFSYQKTLIKENIPIG